MSARITGGPAFPCVWENDSDCNVTAPDGQVVYPGGAVNLHGMTLRDYFAAKAMQGDIASMASHADPAIAGAYIAERAYAIADAMLKAREA